MGLLQQRLYRKEHTFIRQKRRARSEALWAYCLIAPMMLGFVVFFLFSLVVSLGISMTNWSILKAPEWVGLANYRRLLTDELFLKTLKNTLSFALLNVSLGTAISLGLALALSSRTRLRGFYRTIYFMPVLTMPVASATIWKWLYDPGYGPINGLLSAVGLHKVNWLSEPGTAMLAVVIMLIWGGAGYGMVIFLAGLENIPRVYYEAAEIDGAGRLARFRYITLPLLTPTLFFIIVTSIIGSLQVFEPFYVMTKGGPSNTTRTIVYYIYDDAFRNARMGYATAMAWVLVLITISFTLLQFRLQKRWVHYT
jgi:multiple sugar transport system permease protein